METQQISNLLNSAVEQATGQTDIVANDLSNIVSIGKQLNSMNVLDKFTGALVDRIGRTIQSVRPYSSQRRNTLIMDTFQFGAILQKIYVKPGEAVDSPQWQLSNGTTIDQYKITVPEVKQKLFTDRNVYQIDITIPDYQLESAFTSAEAMAAFIDAIFNSISAGMAMREDAIVEATYAACIGENLADQSGTGVHAINLLKEYNDATGQSLAAKNALRSVEFFQFAVSLLGLYVKRLSNMSTLFNVEGYLRHTPAEYVRLTVLSNFAKACDVYLRSNIYHDELVSLPMYSEVNYWQGSGQDYSFDNASKINITTPSGQIVEQSGIIALMSDIEAMGMMIYDNRVRSVRNENGEYTNYFYKMDVRTFVDMSENSIVFYIADEAV